MKIKWCETCSLELKTADDLEYHKDVNHVIFNADSKNKRIKKIKRINKKIVKKIGESAGDILKSAYAKSITKDDLPGFFKEE